MQTRITEVLGTKCRILTITEKGRNSLKIRGEKGIYFFEGYSYID